MDANWRSRITNCADYAVPATHGAAKGMTRLADWEGGLGTWKTTEWRKLLRLRENVIGDGLRAAHR